ncbi:MAG TPA: BON domain-containing protein [Myxococcota bacterium]|nr:BON domain-containing protein [Myxococcota bacterium]
MRIAAVIAVVAIAGLALACDSERRDAAVNQAVMAKISEDPQLAQSSVSVKTEHGHVTLTGQVMTEDQRQIATERAQEVKGVTSVTNDLEIAVSSPPPTPPPRSATVPESPAPSSTLPPAQPGSQPEPDDSAPGKG